MPVRKDKSASFEEGNAALNKAQKLRRKNLNSLTLTANQHVYQNFKQIPRLKSNQNGNQDKIVAGEHEIFD